MQTLLGVWFGRLRRQRPALMITRPSVDEPVSMYGNLRNLWAQAAALALPAPFALWAPRANLRTGGPDPDGDDEDDELRRLMPILALVITVAAVFGG